MIKDDNFLKPEHKQLIKIMLSNEFPLYWTEHQVFPDKRPYLSHAFLLHDKDKNISTVNSNIYEKVLDILIT